MAPRGRENSFKTPVMSVERILIYGVHVVMCLNKPPHDKTKNNDCAPSEEVSVLASAQSDQSLCCGLSGGSPG